MIYLTFPNASEATAALYDGSDRRYPALEILNPIPMLVSQDTGALDADGFPIHALVPGYHVNLRSDDDVCPAELEKWRVNPATLPTVLAS